MVEYLEKIIQFIFVTVKEIKGPSQLNKLIAYRFNSEVDLNTKMINYISRYDIIFNFYNYYGYYTGSFYPRKKNVSGFLNVAQAALLRLW